MGGGVRVTRINYSKTVSENKSLKGQKKLDEISRESLPKKRVFI